MMHNNNLKPSTLLFCFLFAVQCINALPDDKQQPLHIQADHVQIDDKLKQDIYSGHVVLEQGSSTLHGQRLLVSRDAQGHLAKAQMFGNLAIYSTLPHQDEARFTAKAKQIIYQASDGKITLLGQAHAAQQNNVFIGEHLDYYVAKNLVIVPNHKQATFWLDKH